MARPDEGAAEDEGGLAPALLTPLLLTPTMAEIYRKQGHTAQALAIYRRLAERAPEDADLRRKIAVLEQRLAEESVLAAKEAAIDRLKRALRRVQRRRRALDAHRRGEAS